jgi:formamidopyrimidine-DNA glycosylase
MPELPEVETAAGALRAVAAGKVIHALRVLHPALRRRLSAARAKRLAGERVASVERRGKHQVLHLASGATLDVQFRMTGDWEIGRVADPAAPYTRAAIELTDGTRVSLVDPRALSSITWHPPGESPLPALGPEATDPAVTAESLRAVLARRRGPIKPLLLDQRVLAGLGNIYAAEALWQARIDPRRAASSLTLAEVKRLLAGIRKTLAKAAALGGRYQDGTAPPERFEVYDREGKQCRRCRSTVERITQAGRSTYWCPACQQ